MYLLVKYTSYKNLLYDSLFLFLGSTFYLGFYKNHHSGDTISVVIMTSEPQPVSYSIEIPGTGYYHNGTITANNEDVVDLPNNAKVTLPDDQDKGIYLKTSSDKVAVIGQSVRSSTSDTFLGLPIISLRSDVYVYFAMSVPKRHIEYYSAVLIVGTEDNTMMNLTVTQPVTIKVNDTDTNLNTGKRYSFVINRLQTVYVRSVEDLTGSKIVTNKQVSVFSGHECANVPSNAGGCDYLIEQVPSTLSWGTVYYVSPLATKRSKSSIKVLASNDYTKIDIYCNDTRSSYVINEGEFIVQSLEYQKNCVIQSNNKVLTAQFNHGSGIGDPMMTLVPATNHFSAEFIFSTLRNLPRRSILDYVNIIVLAQYYQPEIIYLISGGVKESLDTQKWVPVKVNNVIEAYAATVAISEGVIEITHNNPSALMSTIVYGYVGDSYGHPGSLECKNRGLVFYKIHVCAVY